MKRKHEYSQHFLRNSALVHELIGHSDIKKRDLVYDLGAGTGVIASVLAMRARQVVAVELEPMTYQKLEQNTQRYENVKTLRMDILDVPIPNVPYKIFANIPFALSSPIVRRYTETTHPPESMYFIVQKQFANKLLASDRHFTSELGAMLGPFYTVRIRRTLKKTDFWPHPAVDTVLLEIKPRQQPYLPLGERTQFYGFISHCFRDFMYFTRTMQKSGLTLQKPSHLTPEQWVVAFRANAVL